MPLFVDSMKKNVVYIRFKVSKAPLNSYTGLNRFSNVFPNSACSKMQCDINPERNCFLPDFELHLCTTIILTFENGWWLFFFLEKMWASNTTTIFFFKCTYRHRNTACAPSSSLVSFSICFIIEPEDI